MINSRLRVVLFAGACLGLVTGAVRPAAAQSGDAMQCETAGLAAEQRHAIPDGLLRAIGRVESGRRDAQTGRVMAWPWTINAEGRGKLFDNQVEALAGTRALQQARVASIDVGCFQVNLVHHPAAFASLEDGFDPAKNADYAARFLVSLKARTGSWDGAVAAYHSATPERGIPYRERVMAGMSREGWPADGRPGPVAAPAALVPGPVVRVVTWTPNAASSAMRIWTPSVAGQGASMIVINGPTIARSGARSARS